MPRIPTNAARAPGNNNQASRNKMRVLETSQVKPLQVKATGGKSKNMKAYYILSKTYIYIIVSTWSWYQLNNNIFSNWLYANLAIESETLHTFTFFLSCPACSFHLHSDCSQVLVIPCNRERCMGSEMTGIIVKTLCLRLPDKWSIVLQPLQSPVSVSTSAGNFLSCKAVTLLRLQAPSLSIKSVIIWFLRQLDQAKRCDVYSSLEPHGSALSSNTNAQPACPTMSPQPFAPMSLLEAGRGRLEIN